MEFQFYQTKHYLLVEELPQEVFTMLANLLTYDWEKFARCLSVDDSVIDNVKEEFETTREQTIQVLNQWRKDNPSKQWRDMKTGLIFCKRKDLVSECERSRSFKLHKFLIQRKLFLLNTNCMSFEKFSMFRSCISNEKY